MALAEDELDALYAGPLDRFVARRTELAGRLRAEGRRDDAAAVRGLPKPSAALWAVNRLARTHAGDVRSLAEAAGRLTSGDAGADDDLRQALRVLAEAAPGAVEEAGRKATKPAVDEVVALLRAVAADPDARARLLQGRLREEPEPAGFAAMLGARPPKRTARDEKRDGRAEAETARRESARRIAEAQAEVSEARANARDLRRRAGDAERAARRALEAAERAEAEVERVEAKLDRLRERD